MDIGRWGRGLGKVTALIPAAAVTVIALVMIHFDFPEAATLTSTTSDQSLPGAYLHGCAL